MRGFDFRRGLLGHFYSASSLADINANIFSCVDGSFGKIFNSPNKILTKKIRRTITVSAILKLSTGSTVSTPPTLASHRYRCAASIVCKRAGEEPQFIKRPV